MLSPFYWLIHTVIDIVTAVITAQMILSLLLAFDIINLQNDMVRKVWDILTKLTDPLYAKIRQVIPTFNGIDLSPIIALIGLMFLSRFVSALA